MVPDRMLDVNEIVIRSKDVLEIQNSDASTNS